MTSTSDRRALRSWSSCDQAAASSRLLNLIEDNGTPGQVIHAPSTTDHAKDTLYERRIVSERWISPIDSGAGPTIVSAAFPDYALITFGDPPPAVTPRLMRHIVFQVTATSTPRSPSPVNT